MAKTTHKKTNTEFTPCGEAQYSTAHKLQLAWHWAKVTCKKCLRSKPRER